MHKGTHEILIKKQILDLRGSLGAAGRFWLCKDIILFLVDPMHGLHILFSRGTKKPTDLGLRTFRIEGGLTDHLRAQLDHRLLNGACIDFDQSRTGGQS